MFEPIGHASGKLCVVYQIEFIRSERPFALQEVDRRDDASFVFVGFIRKHFGAKVDADDLKLGVVGKFETPYPCPAADIQDFSTARSRAQVGSVKPTAQCEIIDDSMQNIESCLFMLRWKLEVNAQVNGLIDTPRLPHSCT